MLDVGWAVGVAVVGRSRIAACTDVYHEDGRSWSAEAESHIESRKGVGRFSLEIISAIANIVFYFSSLLILSPVTCQFSTERKSTT